MNSLPKRRVHRVSQKTPGTYHRPGIIHELRTDTLLTHSVSLWCLAVLPSSCSVLGAFYESSLHRRTTGRPFGVAAGLGTPVDVSLLLYQERLVYTSIFIVSDAFSGVDVPFPDLPRESCLLQGPVV